MRFTYESESDDCINFIGLTIKHKQSSNLHGFETSIYRKPTSTSLFTNFNSFTPLAYRLSVFKCLVYRAYHLCSSWNLFHDEIQCIKSMLLRNAYPSWLLDRIIKFSVSNFVQPNVNYGPHKGRLFIGFPYLGKASDHIRRSIKQISKQFTPHKEVIVYFKPGLRVSNFFRIKDPTPSELRSHVVYEFTCATCNGRYIGQTSRHLRQRIAEHLGISHLTGRTMKSQSHSSIRNHCLLCKDSTCASRNFKILAKGNNELELLVKERLLIDRKKPLLNGNIGSFELLL